ncbi:hypothetical protein [Myceligenerans crystallogenes]|uniref:Uncharacterized protein n=1 Tax=Myceligenerans crystallogenes TaxID=316335 RepID=A0ABN2NHR2_9MICO
MSDDARKPAGTSPGVVPGRPATAAAPSSAVPVLAMLADDGAACADGVCAVPDPASR